MSSPSLAREALLERLSGITDPLDLLAAVKDAEGAVDELTGLLREDLRTLRRRAILDLREAGWKWEAIGARLGVSAARAHQLAQPPEGNPR